MRLRKRSNPAKPEPRESTMFTKLEGDMAVIQKGGVWKPADVYEFRGDLYVKANGGYVRVYYDGKTSVAGLRLELLHTEVSLYSDRFGRVSIVEREGYSPICMSDQGKLLQLKNKGSS